MIGAYYLSLALLVFLLTVGFPVRDMVSNTMSLLPFATTAQSGIRKRCPVQRRLAECMQTLRVVGDFQRWNTVSLPARLK